MAVDSWSVLALLRFVLATIVALNHLDEHLFLARLGAFEAVLGFLVISGYSVGVSHAQRPRGFLGRRLRRVYPVYAACLVLALFVDVVVAHQPWPAIGEIVANALLLNQLVTSDSILGPAWSLALECWFYALLPLIARQAATRLRVLCWLSFAAFAAYTACRTLLQWPYYAGIGFGANALLLAFAWLAGTRLARPDADRVATLRDLRWMFAGHVVLDAAIECGHRLKHHEAALFWRADLPAAALHALTLWAIWRCLAWVVARPAPTRQRSRWMDTLGDWSYPLYLVHVPVYALVAAATGLASPALSGLRPAAAFGIALAVAIALHLLLERPRRRAAPADEADTTGPAAPNGASQTIPKMTR